MLRFCRANIVRMDQTPPPGTAFDSGTDPGGALAFDADAFRAAVRAGSEQADRGEGVPHERVRAWLLALARGELDAPPPEAARSESAPL